MIPCTNHPEKPICISQGLQMCLVLISKDQLRDERPSSPDHGTPVSCSSGRSHGFEPSVSSSINTTVGIAELTMTSNTHTDKNNHHTFTSSSILPKLKTTFKMAAFLFCHLCLQFCVPLCCCSYFLLDQKLSARNRATFLFLFYSC